MSLFRDLTADTLTKGWWGAFALVVKPVVVAGNVAAYRRIRELAEPDPGSPRAPLPVGRPMLRRPALALVVVVPLALVGLFLWLAASAP